MPDSVRIPRSPGQGRFGRLLVGTIALSVAVLGLAGCGRLTGGDRQDATAGDTAETTDLSWDAQALESMGFSSDEMVPVAVVATATPAPGTSTAAKDGTRRKHRLVRFAFGKNVLHGEKVVQTDEGTKTVVVQRGTVTAIDAKSLTVKSTDGFTLVWTFGDPLTVVEKRKQIQPSAVVVGTQVGVAGAKSGDSAAARLIVVPAAK